MFGCVHTHKCVCTHMTVCASVHTTRRLEGSHAFMCVFGQSLQSCLTLCDPMDCSPPGSSVDGILQARILEWVAMPSSRGSSWPRDLNHVSCFAGKFFTTELLGSPFVCTCVCAWWCECLFVHVCIELQVWGSHLWHPINSQFPLRCPGWQAPQVPPSLLFCPSSLLGRSTRAGFL